MGWLRLAKYLWASPCTLIGLSCACVPLAFGGSARWQHGVLEVTYRAQAADCGRLARSLHFRGITFGHVILAVSAEELQCIRGHERVHVEQYEQWGPLFIPAYLLSSLWQLLRGRRLYYDNHFEVQARLRSTDVTKAF